MKAMVYKKYGGSENLYMDEVPTPEPKDNQIRVKVIAASLNAADWRLLEANPTMVRLFSGITKPKNNILGRDFSGIVDAIGSSVNTCKVGDSVFGEVPFSHNGCLAEYVVLPEHDVACKLPSISFEQAAAIPMGAITSLQSMRDTAKITQGSKVLIFGASGGVGTFAVQLATHFGAHVSAVCSTRNVDLIKSLGAHRVYDYKKNEHKNITEHFDIILTMNGKYSFAEYKALLNARGIAVLVGGENSSFFQWMAFAGIQSLLSGKKFMLFNAKTTRKDLDFINTLIEAEQLNIIIDKEFSLEELPRAIDYMRHTHCQGKLIIRIADTPSDAVRNND